MHEVTSVHTHDRLRGIEAHAPSVKELAEGIEDVDPIGHRAIPLRRRQPLPPSDDGLLSLTTRVNDAQVLSGLVLDDVVVLPVNGGSDAHS